MQDERYKNNILLGSPQSIYVESAYETDVKIEIKQLCGGWKLAPTNPEVRKTHWPSPPQLKMWHGIDIREILLKLR
mgnify:CR=1 FL=1